MEQEWKDEGQELKEEGGCRKCNIYGKRREMWEKLNLIINDVIMFTVCFYLYYS